MLSTDFLVAIIGILLFTIIGLLSEKDLTEWQKEQIKTYRRPR